MANFVAVRTRYYKHQKGLGVLDHAHAKRNGYTRSSNVHEDFSGDNSQKYFLDSESSMEAYMKVYERHKKLKGKKPRSDMNTLFEHVVVFSEEQYAALEKTYGKDKTKLVVTNRLGLYAKDIQEEFGFEPLGIDLHLDEGTKQEDGSIKRNVHAHVMFYNYDFKRDLAPLRGLMVKGKKEDGKTLDLNPNFQRMQDIAAERFEAIGFQRGISQGIDNRKHEKKAQWIQTAQKKQMAELELNQAKLDEMQTAKEKQTAELEANQAKLDELQTAQEKQTAELEANKAKLDELRSEAKKVSASIRRMRDHETYAKNLANEATEKLLKPLTDGLVTMASNVSENALRELQEIIKAYDKSKPDGMLPESLQRELDDSLRPFRP